MWRATRLLLGLAAVGVLGATPTACAESARPAAAGAVVADPARLPPGQDLYRPPADLIDGPAGTLVWFQGTVSPVAGAQAWRILYRSRGDGGEPILASGLLLRPSTPAPSGGFPVVSWAIGTPGIADRCAPSKYPAVVPRLRRLLQAGFVVVAADGEGLGTRGPAHYLIGRSDAHTILDAARAADGLPGLAASDRVGLWGYSSGGHGALFAAQEAADYAPELDVFATAAVAPVVSVTRFIAPVDDHPGFTFLTVGAWTKVHDIDPATIFTARAMAEVPRLRTECALTLAFDWPLWRRQDLLLHDLRTTEPWRRLMADQLAGTSSLEGPVLLLHGTADSIVAPRPTEALAARLCRFGDTVEYDPISGEDHFIAYTTGARVVDWLAARADGQPASTTC